MRINSKPCNLDLTKSLTQKSPVSNVRGYYISHAACNQTPII
jgi:hypothetical protein